MSTRLAIANRILPPEQIAVGFIGGATLEVVSLYYLFNSNYESDFALTPPVFYDDRSEIPETIDYMLRHVPTVDVAVVSASNNHSRDALYSVDELVKIRENGRNLGIVGIYQSYPQSNPPLENDFQAAGTNAVVQIVDHSNTTLSKSVDSLVLAIRAANNGQYIASERQRSYSHIDLTPREMEIGRLITEGKTNKEIAAEIFLSDLTVKNYVSNLLGKLEVGRRPEIAAYFARNFR